MKRSSDRILTTHVGSLIRPPEIIEVMYATDNHQPYDEAAFGLNLKTGVQDVVRKQAEAGVDIVSDGEFGKRGWTGYVSDRLGGFEARPNPGGPAALFGKDRRDFADFYAIWQRAERTWLPPHIIEALNARPSQLQRYACVAPVTYRAAAIIQRDIANFKAALQGVNVEEAFLPVAAPASAEAGRTNEYYKSDEEYVYAIADALKQEYTAIADAGLLLQVDDAFIPALYDRIAATSMEEYRKFCQLRIEALNYALDGIAEDRVRYHICWGSWNGPHSTDVPLKDIVDLVLRVKAQAYSIEAANPRHEHEWMVWQDTKLPEGKILIPGVVTHSTNIIEHPELVAWRTGLYANLVGRENVIAGTDCGFSQFWNLIRTHESIQWAKLESLAEGARLATKQLWKRAA